MVLRPIVEAEPPVDDEYVSAWSAVEAREKLTATEWWLITQPDHAELAGAIAANFRTDFFPAADRELVRAISMHDAGWSIFESDLHARIAIHGDGRPVSFFEVEPRDFLRAWTASIDRVAEDSARGGYVVSRHFAALGEFRMSRNEDPLSVRAELSDFLRAEEKRRSELARSSRGADWDSLLPLLQFCDILSLYLCSGTRQPVEFPQQFAHGRVRARYDGDVCVLTPSPLSAERLVSVRARRFSKQQVAADFTSIQVTLR